MPERGTSWLQRLRARLAGDNEEAPQRPGRRVTRSGRQAVIEMQAAIGQALCCTAEWSPTPADPSQSGLSLFDSDISAISAAAGVAMTGLRVSACVSTAGLMNAGDVIRGAALRRAPFVIHAAAARGGHGGLRAVTGSGCLTLVARDAQHALDLGLVARLIAEQALVPVVIAVDGPETLDPTADLLLPDEALLVDLLGSPTDEIDCPTASQRMLFGEQRRRVPRWFDPDRPVALGVEPGAGEYDAAAAGRRLFFTEHLLEIAEPALELLGQLTGRPLAALTRFQLDRPRHIIVTQGSAVAAAERVVARKPRERVGVVGLVRTRPFPEAELRDALAGAETVTVLERVDDSETDRPPLLRDVRPAIEAGSCRLLSATFDHLDDSRMEALLTNLRRGDAARASVRLGLASPRRHSDYPRRQVLLDTIARDYPELDARTLPDPDADRQAAGPANASTQLPSVVRRFDQVAATYDSVPRFWGEFIEPRAGGGERSVPDPYLAVGVLPACTATFNDRAEERESAPSIDPARCTACGKCWTACPDSSLNPLVLGSETFLNEAHDATVGDLADDPVAMKLRRAHKQLASRIDGQLVKQPASRLTIAELDAGFDWLADKLGFQGAERETAQRIFAGTRDFLDALGLGATELLFHEAHRRQKGSGSLLMLSLDPRSCQGCGVCAEVCTDAAIEILPQTEDTVAGMRKRREAWERLPDTPGATIQRLSTAPEPGELAAVLMSRHCSMAVTGADGAEPGSGGRLATRQIVAVVEYTMQQRLQQHATELDELTGKLREAIASALERKLPDDDQELLDQLDELAGPLKVDRPRIRELAEAARAIERVRWRLTEGRQGLGRSRYGLAIMGRTTAEWAIPYPHNPFSVPVIVDTTGEGPELAFGVAEGMLAEMTEDFRQVRDARRVLQDSASAPQGLARSELTAEERALCPPLLILIDPETLASAHVAGLARLLNSDLPVKVILLDGRDLLAGGADPALLALAHRQAFVLSSSIAHPGHLFPGLRAALAFTGTALIHIHTPTPRAHGFEPNQMIARARLAVESRVHPLLRYDPSLPGVFGRRLSLDGNPESVSDPAAWAAGESRYSDTPKQTLDEFVARRQDHWAVLQELAGVVTPFTETIREDLEQELRGEQDVAIESLTREHRAKLDDLEDTQRTRQAEQLRDRLLQLAGYRDDPPS
ncbi:MAG: 4Fe-4S binding protein [Acidobacteriota bacterium]|nr:4Fe-4S binding protein [Acidobacteriota bacterium]